jgi:hypothetical protein
MHDFGPRDHSTTSATSQRGQALVEFALVLPLLVLLLVMAVDFGRVFFGWVSINNAARVGAAYAAANADAWEGSGDATRQARYESLVQNDLQAVNCALPSIPDPTVTDVDGDGTYDTGEPVEVALACDFTLITPLATAILGTVELGGAATFPVHYTITTDLPAPPPPPPPPTCTVPFTEGQSRNTARSLWQAASFQPGNLIENGSGNFTVDTQSVPDGTALPCATGSMTISEASGGPTPTPAPTCNPPVANFVADDTRGTTPHPVNFTDLSTTPAACPILSWSWTFESTGSSSLQNPSQVFTHTGNGSNTQYDVSLTVTNAGGSDTESKNNYIRVDRPGDPISAARRSSSSRSSFPSSS